MLHITDLVKKYETVDRDDLDERALLVLRMIEYSVTYPPLQPFTKEDISRVDKCVRQITKDLDEHGQHLFSIRIKKIWKKREHLCELAKTWHEIKKDYMDNLEYHEEVKWLKDEQKRLASK